jgi:DNA-binding response OmpR family regulator
MRVLIVEDEPLIAMDLEDIVAETPDATCVWARTVSDGLEKALSDLDFALLDYNIAGGTSTPVARLLLSRDVPFCFVSASVGDLPAQFRSVPRLSKPFTAEAVRRILSAA